MEFNMDSWDHDLKLHVCVLSQLSSALRVMHGEIEWRHTESRGVPVTGKRRSHRSIDSLRHSPWIEAVVIVAQYAVDVHGVVNDRWWMSSVVVVVDGWSLLMRVMEGVWIHTLGREHGVGMGKFDWWNVQCIVLRRVVHVREYICECEIGHVGSHCHTSRVRGYLGWIGHGTMHIVHSEVVKLKPKSILRASRRKQIKRITEFRIFGHRRSTLMWSRPKQIGWEGGWAGLG